MKFETIKYEKEDGFVVVTMNRPERLNAMNRKFKEEISTAHREVLRDKEVTCWIITGAPRPDGRPCFSAGGDLKDDAEGIPRWDDSDYKGPAFLEEDKMFPVNTPAGRLWAKRPRLMAPRFINLAWSPKISIAAVDGVATAGGIELALACDIILASETAKFADSHVKNLKIAIGKGSVTTTLTKRVGYSKALELCILGDFIDGNEAYRIGLANRVYPPDKLMEEAKKMARTIASMRPAAVQTTKLACRAVFDKDFNQTWAYADELLESLHCDPEWSGLQGVTKEWEKRKR
jgi:enoyl-CoA hydratase/carnithine racemase